MALFRWHRGQVFLPSLVHRGKPGDPHFTCSASGSGGNPDNAARLGIVERSTKESGGWSVPVSLSGCRVDG